MSVHNPQSSRKTGPAGSPSPAGLICDLDALIADPIYFKFDGQIYEIRPLSTETFFRVVAQLEKMDSLKAASKEEAVERVIELYAELFQMVCPEFGIEQVKKMNQQQALSLLQTVVDTISGKAQADIEKKKTENRYAILREPAIGRQS